MRNEMYVQKVELTNGTNTWDFVSQIGDVLISRIEKKGIRKFQSVLIILMLTH